MTNGIRMIPCTARLPLKDRLSAKASGSPITSRISSDPIVKTKELRTVCQKTGSAKRRW